MGVATQINPDSRVLQGLSTFLSFVGLNVLFLLCCLPIVTIPAATSALFRVTIRYADDELGRPFRDFLPAFASGFVQATAVGFALLLPGALLAFSAAFWFSAATVVGAVAAGIAALGAVYAFVSFLCGMALGAQYRNTVRRTIRNALLLPAAEPLRTGGILIIPVTAVCLTIIFPPFIVLVLTIFCSAGAYLAAMLFRSIFARRTNESMGAA
jgi:uncharacterized membrane protein YesL